MSLCHQQKNISASNGDWSSPSSAKRRNSVSHCCGCLWWCDLGGMKRKKHFIFVYVQHMVIHSGRHVRLRRWGTESVGAIQAVCAVGPADEDQCLLWVPWGECVSWWVGSNPCLPRRFSNCIGAVNQVGSHTPSMFLLACPPNQTSQVPNDSSRKCHAKANRKNSIETNQWTTIITHRVHIY